MGAKLVTSGLSSSRLLPSLAALATAAAIVSAAIAPSWATPLDADACNKVKTEHQHLETAGVDQDMAKGPEWAKANLGPERLSQVRRFIELEELILFRCRSKTLVTLPPHPETPAAAAKGKAERKTGAGTAPARKDNKARVAPKAATDGPAAGRRAKTPPTPAPEPKQKAPARAAAAARPAGIDREANTSSFAKSARPGGSERAPADGPGAAAAN